jgi:hypothetical protein
MATEILGSPPSPSRGLSISAVLDKFNPHRLFRFLRNREKVVEISAGPGKVLESTAISEETMVQLRETDAMFKRVGQRKEGIYKKNSPI